MAKVINYFLFYSYSQCKYRGLIIGNKLNLATHIAPVKSKISKCVGLLMKARQGLSRKYLLGLYYSFAYKNKNKFISEQNEMRQR